MADPIVAGRYILKRRIGEGGMGQVWEAEDSSLKRCVALKLMSAAQVDWTPARIRFEREATAIARLRDPHVVSIYDYGIDRGRPYIAMELLDGEDLQARLSRVKRLPLSAVASVVTQVARGLAAAHAAGIVHRDLKPANVLFARTEAAETVKILDFGVAAMLTGCDSVDLTCPGDLVGTPAYMSPEQVRDSTVDHRSDLWSLGIMAYHALTGELPFTGKGVGSLVISICTDPFPPPSGLLPELSREVDRFFVRALAKDPTQRFQSARELAAAFASLGDEARLRSAKILVVDDEPDTEFLVKHIFRRQIQEGIYEISFAADGERALDALRADPDIDVILTDINMPRMDGLTLLSHIGEVNPYARAVVVSAYGDMKNIRAAMNRGAFDFVTKPVNPKDLQLTVHKTYSQVNELRKSARSIQENNTLRMFVSPLVIERLRSADGLGAWESVKGSVIFIQLAGLHDAAGKKLDEAIRSLNASFEVIVPELTTRGGVVDRFVRDAVVVIFRGPSHLANALDACLAVRSQLETLNHRAGKDSPLARALSIGVAAGEIILGEVGSRSCGRLDYAAMGEAASVAAQLAAMAAPNEILLSGDACADEGSLFQNTPRGEHAFVGASGPRQIVEIVSRRSHTAPAITSSAQADRETVAVGEPVTRRIRS
ncbi:protein kinase domain-containing protein [Sorangium sp. So ce131]|uniref:protein kinase domain-containing protein n=1 Tax=Sorangium sp. So ce131 TaxID=3133282 RepID=UPI003F6234DF